jgi:hypothetical protein
MVGSAPASRRRLGPKNFRPPRHRRRGVGPGGAVGTMLTTVMAGVARDVRGGGGVTSPPIRTNRPPPSPESAAPASSAGDPRR